MKRGAKTGSGEISAWIVKVLQVGPATREEMAAGSPYTMHQIGNAADRMKVAGAIVLHRERAPGLRRQYRLSGDKRYADEVVYAAGPRRGPISARDDRGSNNPDCDLENAFRRIVRCD